MTVYLVPVGRRRFELYSEPSDGSADQAWRSPGFIGRQAERVRKKWHEVTHAARAREQEAGWVVRWRNALVRHTAERIGEQRTLWALRGGGSATAVYPAGLEDRTARAILNGSLEHARRFHRRWMILDAFALVLSGALAVLPGPNLVAYYFALRFFGHILCWRGARQALEHTNWSTEPELALAELGSLVDLPRDARAQRVEAIAERLKLPRLVAFFDRAAVPVR